MPREVQAGIIWGLWQALAEEGYEEVQVQVVGWEEGEGQEGEERETVEKVRQKLVILIRIKSHFQKLKVKIRSFLPHS